MSATVAQQLAADITKATERQMLGAVALAEVLVARGWVNPMYAATAHAAEWAELWVHLTTTSERCASCGKPITHAEQCCKHVKLRTGEHLYECKPCAVRNGRRTFPVTDVDAERSAS